jgi:hypothetical protein
MYMISPHIYNIEKLNQNLTFMLQEVKKFLIG